MALVRMAFTDVGQDCSFHVIHEADTELGEVRTAET
jgi:hypothetical protein